VSRLSQVLGQRKQQETGALAIALLFGPFALHMALALFAVHVLISSPRAPQVIILCDFRLRRSAIRHFDRSVVSVCARLSFALLGSTLSFVSSIYDGWPEVIVILMHESRGSLAASIINKMVRVNACYIRFICPDSIVLCSHRFE
jgi:hypothetical protein